MKKILFVCVHNSGRSQMAEAFFNLLVKGKAQGFSAGTQPAASVNPVVVLAMGEIGIDISNKIPKLLTLEMLEGMDRVVTMGCGTDNVCPATFVPTEDWQLEDPEGKPLESVREIRNEIERRIKRLISELHI